MVSTVWLARCGAPIDGSDAAPAAPAADRESWNSLIELGESGTHVAIKAAYLRDFADRQETHADSGAEMTISDSAGTLRSRLTAERLVVSHRENRLDASGAVSVDSQDSLQLRGDSLVWERSQRRMRVPGHFEVQTPTARLTGRNLSTTTKLDGWSAQLVTATLTGASASGTYEVRLRARHDSTSRGEGLVARYDSVVAEVEGYRIHSASAEYDEIGGQILFSGQVTAEDVNEDGTVSRRTRAAELQFDVVEDRKTARGGVEVVEFDGGMRLSASSLDDEALGRWTARGTPADLELGGRSFSATRLAYDELNDEYTAAEATFRDEGRTLRADSLIYSRALESIDAWGDITLTLPGMDGVARGDSTHLDLSAERAELRGSSGSGTAHLSKWRERGDSLFISAALLGFDLKENHLTGSGGFSLRGPDLVVTGDSGWFDSASERVGVAGTVLFRQADSDAAGESRLEADSMTVHLGEGRIESMQIPSGLSGRIHGLQGQTSWLRASGGDVFFDSERLQRVELRGGAQVTHRSSTASTGSRFRAEMISLHFDGRGALGQVLARGDAELTSRDVPAAADDDTTTVADDSNTSINRVTGAELDIRLAAGKVVEVEITGLIEGRYLPSREEGDE